MKGQAKILIVDDDADVLESTASMVRSLGYRSATLADHRRLAAVIEQERPDLILQDVRMPGLRLAPHLARLRADPRGRAVPVVLFSGDPEVSTLAAEHDAQGFLAKPFDPGQLVFLLRHLLTSPKAPPSSSPPREFRNELAAVRAFIDAMRAGRPMDEGALGGLRRALGRLERAADALEKRPLSKGG